MFNKFFPTQTCPALTSDYHYNLKLEQKLLSNNSLLSYTVSPVSASQKSEGTSCNQFNPIHAGWTCRASHYPRTSSTTLQTKNIWIQRLQSQGYTIHSYPSGWCCITCGVVLLQTKQKSLLHSILISSAA